MAGTNEHTPKGRLLGAELREHRKKADLTVREMAQHLGTSHVTISRYETGARIPHPEDVARILATLRVTGTEYEELVDFARNAGEKNTFARTSSNPHKHLVDLAEFERSAVSIVDVAPKVIPGLLQTAYYAREVMRGLPVEEREIRVGLRMSRRDVLLDTSPPHLKAIVAEHALREPLGGHEVMAAQLRHLQNLVARSGLALRVMPSDLTRWTPAHDGAFVLFEFHKAPPIVHLEHFRSSAFLFDSKDVAAYQHAVPDIETATLSSSDSAELVESIATEMERCQCH